MKLCDYPFRKTRDIRTAMAETLSTYLAQLEFDLPATTEQRRFAAAYATWAEFEQSAKSEGGRLPVVAVLPDEGKYDDSSLSPRILEETWRSDGTGGYALFAIAEFEVPFVALVRARSKGEREAITSVLEDAFVEPGEAQDAGPLRYGRLLTMPAYYGRTARYTLLTQRLLDSGDFAIRHRWMSQFELLAQAQHVVVRKAAAMSSRVQVVVDGQVYNR
jgi:hypothetical protein